jgi:hypothetical protein
MRAILAYLLKIRRELGIDRALFKRGPAFRPALPLTGLDIKR